MFLNYSFDKNTMAIEIERKFLVTQMDWKTDHGIRLIQGYLNRAKERTVRIRIHDRNAFITIKGPTLGATRQEFEYDIPLDDAEKLLLLCDGPIINKTRYLIEHENNTWEVDEFHGDNDGLVVAEIELQSEDQHFEKPDWLGEEVTYDERYFNSNLSKHPYCDWKK